MNNILRFQFSVFRFPNTFYADLTKKPCVIAVKRYFSNIFFYFSVKAFIFVRLMPDSIVFALFDVQFDKRKLTAGYFKLHRLLYFTRAVRFAHSEMNHRVGVGR